MEETSTNEIIGHYFRHLKEDIICGNIREEGITGYLIAIAEYWEELSREEDWQNCVYFLLFRLSNMIKNNINILGISCFGGIADILWTVSLLVRKVESISPFYYRIKEIAISLFASNLVFLEKQLEKNIVKTEYYDLVNGVSGVGMYYLSEELISTKEKNIYMI